jgi:O-Antigen ligase
MIDSSHPLRVATVTSSTPGDSWLLFAAFVLAGYAFIGKGFAYVGLPPIYIGEIAYLTGIVVFLRSRCIVGSFASLPGALLALSMAWVLLRTAPFVGTYGVDALRDSVVIVYGGFAFIVVALLLEDPRRIDSILRYYDRFARTFVPLMPFVFVIERYLIDYIPQMPNANAPILEVRSGEVAVHLAGAAAFALAGFSRVGWGWILAICATAVMAASQGRGAMLAFAVPVVVAAVFVGKTRVVARIAVLIPILVFATMTVETTFQEYHPASSTAERSIDPHQLVDNVISTFTESGSRQGESTKTWRLDWWNIIVADTLFGPNFWTGRGFGLNLADADGFQDVDDPSRPVLRSPHNVHMTILARAGVPGLTLWFAFILSWFGAMLWSLQIARQRGQVVWSRLFLFVTCYVLSILVDATFDVAIEGPMIGIWFWCLIGFGIGTVMVYRAGRTSSG